MHSATKTPRPLWLVLLNSLIRWGYVGYSKDCAAVYAAASVIKSRLNGRTPDTAIRSNLVMATRLAMAGNYTQAFNILEAINARLVWQQMVRSV